MKGKKKTHMYNLQFLTRWLLNFCRVAKFIGDTRAVVAEKGFNRPYSKVIISKSGEIRWHFLLAFTNYITKSHTIAEVHHSFFPLKNGFSSWLCKTANAFWQGGYFPPFHFIPSISSCSGAIPTLSNTQGYVSGLFYCNSRRLFLWFSSCLGFSWKNLGRAGRP